jgi:hypothetical protein
MLLLKGLKDNRLGQARDTTAQYRDRWEKLESYRCNPWSDVEMAEMIIKAIDPSPTPTREIQRGFHPRSRTTKFHLLNARHTEDMRRSFAFLRMFEEGAMPFRCNAVAFFPEAVVNAAKCVASAAPHMALNGMLRTLTVKQIEERFDYLRIATLKLDEVNYLYELSIKSFVQAAQQLQTAGAAQRSLLITDTAQIRTRLFAQLLSRLCLRLSQEQLEQLYGIATEAYALTAFRQDLHQHECPGLLFEGVLEVLTQERVLQLMPELLKLPIPTEHGFDVQEPQLWREPFTYIDWDDGTQLNDKFDRTAWAPQITNLIRIVQDGTAEARTRAILRLAKLHEIKGLSADQKAAFGAALWTRLDENTGLPTHTGHHDFGLLHLPSPDPDRVRGLLRDILNSRDFTRIIRRTTTPDGRTGISMGNGIAKNPLIKEWLGTTAHPLAAEEVAREYVDWTIDEVGRLLVKAAAWWDDEKAMLSERSMSDPFDFAGTLRNQFSQLVKLLQRIVLPKLAAAEANMQDLALRILGEMEALGVLTAPALPATLFIAPSENAEISRKLRVGLYSADENIARAATIGIYNWYIANRVSRLPAPESDLLGDLVSKIVARKEPGLDSAMDSVTRLLSVLSDLFHDDQLDNLCLALEYLIPETAMEGSQHELIAYDGGSIALYDRPLYRELAVRLAAKLSAVFTAAGRELPTVLIRWREIASNDPLPAVRRAWV